MRLIFFIAYQRKLSMRQIPLFQSGIYSLQSPVLGNEGNKQCGHSQNYLQRPDGAC